MTMSSYDGELVMVSIAEEDVDPETNFLTVVPGETADAEAVRDCGWAESRWEGGGGSTAVIWCSGGRSHRPDDGDPAKEVLRGGGYKNV
jgi:hypothetical protein